MSYSGCFEITINAEGQRRVVPVRLGSAEIGRSSDNAIRLDGRNVSRRHARLLRQGRKIWVEDLTSANGSYVNGEKISGRTRIFRNDVIRLGDVELELQGESLSHRDDETTDRTGPLAFVALQEPQPTALVRDTDPSAPPLPEITPVTTNAPAANDTAPDTATEAVSAQPTTEPQIVYQRGSWGPALVILVAAAVGTLLVTGALILRAKSATPTVTGDADADDRDRDGARGRKPRARKHRSARRSVARSDAAGKGNPHRQPGQRRRPESIDARHRRGPLRRHAHRGPRGQGAR